MRLTRMREATHASEERAPVGSQNLGQPQDCNYGEWRADLTGWVHVTGKYVQTLGPHQQGHAHKVPSVTSPQNKAGPGQRKTDTGTDLQLLATRVLLPSRQKTVGESEGQSGGFQLIQSPSICLRTTGTHLVGKAVLQTLLSLLSGL